MTETQAVQNAEQPSAEFATTALAGIPATRAPRPRRDASRTRSEARLVFRAPLVGGDDGFDSRRFSVLDVTSGLPDDSRDDDQRVRSKREHETRGRVQAAKAVIQAHPGLAQVLARDQTKLGRFCAVHHVTPQELCPHAEDNGAAVRAPGTPRDGMCSYCNGWHGWQAILVEDVQEVLASPADWMAEVRAREAACLPSSDQ